MALALLISAIFLKEYYDMLIPPIVSTFCIIMFLIIMVDVYAALASVILLMPALMIILFGNREIEKETWFWVVTAISIVAGSIAFTRYGRIWKYHRR